MKDIIQEGCKPETNVMGPLPVHLPSCYARDQHTLHSECWSPASHTCSSHNQPSPHTSHLEDLDLHSAITQQASDSDGARLPDAVHARDSLLLYGRVWGDVQQKHMIGSHQCQPCRTVLQEQMAVVGVSHFCFPLSGMGPINQAGQRRSR